MPAVLAVRNPKRCTSMVLTTANTLYPGEPAMSFSFKIPSSMLSALLCATWLLSAPAHAQVDEAQAKAAASELALMVTEATAIIGGLQADINGGTAADKVKTDALVAAFQSRYAKAAGKPFETKPDGLAGESRKAFAIALNDTLGKFHSAMAKGGQDAFVPAFFRAELLKRFNAQLKGKIQGYATNRDNELINADWAVNQVMKGSPLMSEVNGLVTRGESTHQMKRHSDRVMGYWPMKLGSACVACHARSGLKQTEGAFGGALVAEVFVK